MTIEMSMEQIQIKFRIKRITHAFLQFKVIDERDNFVRSGNTLKKELRVRKVKIFQAMDAEEGFQQTKTWIHQVLHSHRKNVPLVQIKMNRSARHVSQIVIKTCANGSLKYYKYQDIEAEVETTVEKWMTKKLVATTVISRAAVRTNGRDDCAAKRSQRPKV